MSTHAFRLLRTLKDHFGTVHAIVFSPDEKYIASGSRVLLIWEVATGRLKAHTWQHKGAVWAVAFSPDGKYIASGSKDATLRLWELRGRIRRRRILKDHSDTVSAVAFSPDGNLIVSGSFDGTLRLWEVATGLSLTPIYHTKEVTAVAFSPDGRHIVLGSGDGTPQLSALKDMPRSSTARTLKGHTGWVYDVAFSPDGKYVVSGSHDRMLRLWEVATGHSRILCGHTQDAASPSAPTGSTSSPAL